MSPNNSIIIYYTRYYRDTLGLPNWSELAYARVNEAEEEKKRIRIMEQLIGPIKHQKILSVGCGTGGFCLVAHKRGGEVWGIDPDSDAIAICKAKVKSLGISPAKFQVATGESLPFKNNTFDVIQCYTVLEHVASVGATCHEMIRVVKPGGKIYIHSPNYLYPYEGHYKLAWIPLLPKSLGKIYLRLRGRPPAFIQTINYLTPNWVKSACISGGGKVAREASQEPVPTGMLDYLFARITAYRISPHIELVVTKNKV